jgi:hypothetical protein
LFFAEAAAHQKRRKERKGKEGLIVSLSSLRREQKINIKLWALCKKGAKFKP